MHMVLFLPWLALLVLGAAPAVAIIASSGMLPKAMELWFDGSRRPPRDVGFPTMPSSATMAAAGAVIWHDGQLVAVGGRTLPAGTLSESSSSSSAAAEYQALLLGLEHLHSTIDRNRRKAPSTIILRGDCKTVTDQLRGRSVPRKLSAYHAQAVGLLEEIKRSGNGDDVDVRTQHVPRQENGLCDALCASVMEIRCRAAVARARRELGAIHARSREQQPSSVDENELRSFLLRTLESPSSLIPHSSRPRFYDDLAAIATSAEAYGALLNIGEAYASHAERWRSHRRNSNQQHCCEHLIKANRYLLRACEGLGDSNKAARLHHRLRMLQRKSVAPANLAKKAAPPPQSLRTNLDPRSFAPNATVLVDWVDRARQMDWDGHGVTLWVDTEKGSSEPIECWNAP